MTLLLVSYNNQKYLHCARCCGHKSSLGAIWVDNAGREPTLDTIEAQGFAREEASSEFGHKAFKRQPSILSRLGDSRERRSRAIWVDVVERPPSIRSWSRDSRERRHRSRLDVAGILHGSRRLDPTNTCKLRDVEERLNRVGNATFCHKNAKDNKAKVKAEVCHKCGDEVNHNSDLCGKCYKTRFNNFAPIYLPENNIHCSLSFR